MKWLNSFKTTLKNNLKPIAFLAIGVLLGAILVPTGFALQNRLSQKEPMEQPFKPSTYTIDLGPNKDTSNVTGSNNQPNNSVSPSTGSTQSDVPPTTNNAKPKTSASSSNTAPTTAPSTSQAPSQPVATCNETLKASYTNRYNADIAYENDYHESELSRIARYYAAKGAYDSSARMNAQALENSRHEASLAQIASEYQTKLAEIYCV